MAAGATDPLAPAERTAPSGPVHRALVRLGNLLFSTRNALFPVVFLVIAALSVPIRPFGSARAETLLDGIGIGVALLGQALRAAVIGLAYIRRGGKDRRIHADDLVVTGLFAHSRNPLYLGNMLVFLGLFLVLNSRLGYLVGVPFFFVAYLAITLAEEEFLGRRFGAAYREYCRRVNRFVPSLAGLGATLRGMAFDWKRLIRKEYGSAFAWVTTALALLIWEEVVHRGWQAASPLTVALGIVWLAALALYACARYLKKTGRLASA